MRIKFDENMPRPAMEQLKARGHDIDTVVDEGLRGEPDEVIARAAAESGRMLFTLDRGFPAPTKLPDDHPGVIVFKLASQSIPAVEAAIGRLLDLYSLEDLRGCVVVVAPGRIRVRRA